MPPHPVSPGAEAPLPGLATADCIDWLELYPLGCGHRHTTAHVPDTSCPALSGASVETAPRRQGMAGSSPRLSGSLYQVMPWLAVATATTPRPDFAPAIHVLMQLEAARLKTWMPGSSPGKGIFGVCGCASFAERCSPSKPSVKPGHDGLERVISIRSDEPDISGVIQQVKPFTMPGPARVAALSDDSCGAATGSRAILLNAACGKSEAPWRKRRGCCN
jgi:hypothetical protein